MGLDAMVGSFVIFLWAAVFLLFFVWVFALIFVQTITDFRIDNPDCDSDLCDMAPGMFGNLGDGMIVLLECTTGGRDWVVVYDVMLLTGQHIGLSFIFFIMFITFSFNPIVFGVCVNQA